MKNSRTLIIFFVAALSGCGSVQETAKVVWGSSTKALEEARANAAVKTFNCSYAQCFDAVLSYVNAESKEPVDLTAPVTSALVKPVSETDAQYSPTKNFNAPDALASKKKNFSLFIKDPIKRHIVLMGVPGVVDTTEVGIFFTPQEGGTRIEVSSLSTAAKLAAADILFAELGKTFKEDAGR